MTEQEWLTSDDPEAMFRFLKQQINQRQRSLFGCACCRAVWPLLYHHYSRDMVDVVERYVDGLATREELHEAKYMGEVPAFGYFHYDKDLPLIPEELRDTDEKLERLRRIADFADRAVTERYWFHGYSWAWDDLREFCHLGNLVREIVGNPFRHLTLESYSLTSTVFSIADYAYHERNYDCLPILADALEEAGCGDELILTHLRGPGPHVRGCWVLDLLLNKG